MGAIYIRCQERKRFNVDRDIHLSHMASERSGESPFDFVVFLAVKDHPVAQPLGVPF